MTNHDGGTGLLATAAWFTGMGWVIAVSIVLGVVAGNWLDGQSGRHPLFLLLGLVLGLALGLFSAGRMLLRFLGETSGGPPAGPPAPNSGGA